MHVYLLMSMQNTSVSTWSPPSGNLSSDTSISIQSGDPEAHSVFPQGDLTHGTDCRRHQTLKAPHRVPGCQGQWAKREAHITGTRTSHEDGLRQNSEDPCHCWNTGVGDKNEVGICREQQVHWGNRKKKDALCWPSQLPGSLYCLPPTNIDRGSARSSPSFNHQGNGRVVEKLQVDQLAIFLASIHQSSQVFWFCVT